MKVTVNGEAFDLPTGATVVDLLTAMGLGRKWVLVERNGEALARADLGSTALAEGDRVELVRAVAGG